MSAHAQTALPGNLPPHRRPLAPPPHGTHPPGAHGASSASAAYAYQQHLLLQRLRAAPSGVLPYAVASYAPSPPKGSQGQGGRAGGECPAQRRAAQGHYSSSHSHGKKRASSEGSGSSPPRSDTSGELDEDNSGSATPSGRDAGLDSTTSSATTVPRRGGPQRMVHPKPQTHTPTSATLRLRETSKPEPHLCASPVPARPKARNPGVNAVGFGRWGATH